MKLYRLAEDWIRKSSGPWIGIKPINPYGCSSKEIMNLIDGHLQQKRSSLAKIILFEGATAERVMFEINSQLEVLSNYDLDDEIKWGASHVEVKRSVVICRLLAWETVREEADIALYDAWPSYGRMKKSPTAIAYLA